MISRLLAPEKPWRRSLILTTIVAVALLVLALPAFRLSGRAGLVGLISAALLCLTPGWLVFAIHSRYGTATPVAAFLFGTVGRLFITLGGVIAMMESLPQLGMMSFGLWLGIFYILTLVVETKLLLMSPTGDVSAKD